VSVQTATPAPINDPDPLLAPISEEAPAGVWLRFEPVYDEIKRLRAEEDAGLPQGIWQRELKRADWPAVADLCTQVLAGTSKDLQIAAWLTEAWIHLHGFQGLERGARLLAGLCRRFWPDLYPLLDGEDTEARLAPIAWAAERLALPLKRVSVTAPTGDDATAYGWKDWEAGLYLANLSRLDAAAAAKEQERGMVPQAKFQVSVSLTPGTSFGRIVAEIAGALAGLDGLDAALAEACGPAAPSLTPLRSPLVAIEAFALRVLEERGESELALPAVQAAGWEESLMNDKDGEPNPAAASGSISSRADAYHRLNQAAEFLLRTEPHSPVPYLVQRAVSWGNLSLAELLQELLQKNADLPTVYALLGIKRSS
ncbi:MAG TPA: type VI secretion system protein TssA, partial [Thermoanaerobaculia bacterium]|nr:type VI secretion system protein TssA [Thermoanaerobaculia bacterium]